ncbi:hypothetical protein DY931_21335 [Pseudomonas aeruginosa]|uniref:hypothetical protein n=1 Tax=Pseudomonas aeruginosa TaxID=287 RepID=UPI000F82803B|nr:hypothetical protein [Pseudomonas aeruginosa]RTR58802.1 hypothetical protein DY931_21335 [Pseudomonas aeruginosa]
MGRNRPKSFARWIAGILGATITALVIYQLRIQRAEYRLEHDFARIQQQFQHSLAPQLPAVQQRSPEELSALKEAARRQAEIDRRSAAERAAADARNQLKEEAWSKYFTPTQRCQIPESQRMVEVCEASEAKFRARFEADWASRKGA